LAHWLRRFGRIALWAGTVVVLVSSFHEPAATYDWALRPSGDSKNRFAVPWPAEDARKWMCISAALALFRIALAAGIQARLLRSLSCAQFTALGGCLRRRS
jgi:hypothetical protein